MKYKVNANKLLKDYQTTFAVGIEAAFTRLIEEGNVDICSDFNLRITCSNGVDNVTSATVFIPSMLPYVQEISPT